MATYRVHTDQQAQDRRANVTFRRRTGVFGLAVVALSWAQFPLYSMTGVPPAYNGTALAESFHASSTIVFIRILLDLGLYVALMVFAARFAHLVMNARPGLEWLGMLTFGSAAVWIGVTLVANGLEGGAALDTLGGSPDASAVRALVEGYLLTYNGSIAFAITALFIGAAGYATFVTGILPRWTGWLAYAATALCVVSVPVVFAGPLDYNGFWNPGGWGPAIIANFPPLIWFLAVGVVMLRKPGARISAQPLGPAQ